MYSGCNSGFDCLFPDLFPVFCGSSVHRSRKYCLNRLFFQNNRNIRDLRLQFDGLLAITLFDTYSTGFFGRNGLQMPLVAFCCDHVGEIGIWQGFSGYWETCSILLCGRSADPNFSKKTRMKSTTSHQSNENFALQTQFPFVCSTV